MQLMHHRRRGQAQGVRDDGVGLWRSSGVRYRQARPAAVKACLAPGTLARILTTAEPPSLPGQAYLIRRRRALDPATPPSSPPGDG